METGKISVFLNRNLKKSLTIPSRPYLSVKQIISESSEQFGLRATKDFCLYDNTGGELSDDDIELLQPQEPLFLSQGEKFSKECCLSIFSEIKLLGQGGFGIVKLYQNNLTGEEVAMKFVDYRTLSNTEDVLRMYNEITVLRGLRHTNIVKLLDAFDLESKFCFVMEYCSGGELGQYIKQKGPLPEEEIYKLGSQIVDAMRYCHNSKVIHRDLKPENVLFSTENKTIVKIVDFGIAGMFSIGRTGEVSEAGSLYYTAPEVISGKNFKASPALDVWGLGCIIYMMLTGLHPFIGKTQELTIENILSGKYSKLPKGSNPHWEKFFRKIFKLQPEQRWTMLEIQNYFDKLMFGEESSEETSEEAEVEELKKIEEVKVVRKTSSRKATEVKPLRPVM